MGMHLGTLQQTARNVNKEVHISFTTISVHLKVTY